jgi:hypothetical protein
MIGPKKPRILAENRRIRHSANLKNLSISTEAAPKMNAERPLTADADPLLGEA